tara:strand:+ start:2332 stop:2694 length:363 start_codon:yes stop_codon:yes gene_type:complete
MKTLLPFLLIIAAAFLVAPTPFPATPSSSEDYDINVLQINASWNKKNSIKLEKLNGCNVQYAYLESQSKQLQERFSKIPIIAVTKKSQPNKPLGYWEGNIMFESTITIEELQKVIDTLNQ